MAKTKKVSPEETLRALYNLQVIDSKIDKMREVRGELPLEVEGLEDELTGLSGRVDKIQSDLEDFEKSIADKKNTIAEAKDAIKKYADQQTSLDIQAEVFCHLIQHWDLQNPIVVAHDFGIKVLSICTYAWLELDAVMMLFVN